MKLNHNPVVNGLGTWVTSAAANTAGENWFAKLPENESFLGDIVSVDLELGEQPGSAMDDAIYFGSVSGGFRETDIDGDGLPNSAGEIDYDLDGVLDTGWSGALYRIILNDDTDPANWIFGSNNSFGNPVPGQAFVEIGSPVTAAPNMAPDTDGNIWIFAGTGRYLDEEDDFDQDSQWMLGVMEPIDGNEDLTGESVAMSDLLDVSLAKVYYGETKNDSVVIGVPGVANFDDLEDSINNDPSSSAYRGWKKELLMGLTERVITNPLVYGGLVLTSSYAPNRNVCAAGGNSWLYGLYYRTGSAYYKPTFDDSFTGGGGSHNGQPLNIEFISTGPGKGSSPVVDDPGGDGETNVNIQSSSGALGQVPIDTPITTDSGKMFWKNEF